MMNMSTTGAIGTMLRDTYRAIDGERVAGVRRRKDGIVLHAVIRWGRFYWTADGVTWGSLESAREMARAAARDGR